MHDFISKSESKDAPQRQSHMRGNHADVNFESPTVAANEVPTILRKASCACGGGCPACQANSGNLEISQPNDPAEIEADRIADRVMRMSIDDAKPESYSPNSPNKIHRKCDACEDDEGEASETIQRKESFASAAPQSAPGIFGSLGRPLDAETRSFFEPRFGRDLGHVRIHTGNESGETARNINATAFSLGNHIGFSPRAYDPASSGGKRLLAHELAHVEQAHKGNNVLHRQSREEVIGRSEPPSEQDPEIAVILRASSNARSTGGTSKMIYASEVGYRMVKAFMPNYSGTLSSVGYDENGKGVAARRSGEKGVNIELTIGKGFLSRLNNTTIMDLVIELRDALKATGVPTKPQDNPRSPTGLVESIRQSQSAAKAKENHITQQKKVAELIASAKAVTRGNSSSDTLLQNSIEWIEPKKEGDKENPPKFGMVILTPTHDSGTRKPGDNNARAFFDTRVKYPTLGGDYDPTGANDDGVRYAESGLLGTASHPPLDARSVMQFFSINIVIDDNSPVTMERLSRTLIHETQHMANRIESGSGFFVEDYYRSYQTEFIAYWTEVEVSEKMQFMDHWMDKNQQRQDIGALDLSSGSKKKGLGSAENKAEKATVKGSDIKSKEKCLGFYPKCGFENKEQSTNFKNQKQQRIFEHLVATYTSNLVDCCYVCDDKFRGLADNFSGPVGVNIVNSVRIESLLNAADNCKPDMDVKDKRVDKMLELVKLLDDTDIKFLNDSLPAFAAESKAEATRQAEEKKKEQSKPLDVNTAEVSKLFKSERGDVPVSFWLYLMRRLPNAGLKMVQDAVRARAKSATKKP